MLISEFMAERQKKQKPKPKPEPSPAPPKPPKGIRPKELYMKILSSATVELSKQVKQIFS